MNKYHSNSKLNKMHVTPYVRKDLSYDPFLHLSLNVLLQAKRDGDVDYLKQHTVFRDYVSIFFPEYVK